MLSSPILSARDGISTHVLELSKYLNELGCEIHILSLDVVNTDFETKDFVVHTSRVSRHNHMSLYPSLLRKASRRLMKLNEAHRFDIIHGHGGYFGAAALIRNLGSKTPCISTIHGVMYDEYSRRVREVRQLRCLMPSKMAFKRALRAVLFLPFIKVYGTWVYNVADLNIASCTFVAKLASQAYSVPSSRIQIIPHAIDVKRFSSLGHETDGCRFFGASEPVILYLGQLIARKGLITLLKAFSIVKKKKLDAQLVLVGRGYMEEVLNDLASKLGISGSFTIHNSFIPHRDLPKVYAASDIFVVPSIYECGISTTLLEAMAAGKTVITTTVGGLPEVVIDGTTGLLVELGDTHLLAKKILLLLEDVAYAKKLGENARSSIISKFDWTTVSQKVYKTYEHVASCESLKHL